MAVESDLNALRFVSGLVSVSIAYLFARWLLGQFKVEYSKCESDWPLSKKFLYHAYGVGRNYKAFLPMPIIIVIVLIPTFAVFLVVFRSIGSISGWYSE